MTHYHSSLNFVACAAIFFLQILFSKSFNSLCLKPQKNDYGITVCVLLLFRIRFPPFNRSDVTPFCNLCIQDIFRIFLYISIWVQTMQFFLIYASYPYSNTGTMYPWYSITRRHTFGCFLTLKRISLSTKVTMVCSLPTVAVFVNLSF